MHTKLLAKPVYYNDTNRLAMSRDTDWLVKIANNVMKLSLLLAVALQVLPLVRLVRLSEQL